LNSSPCKDPCCWTASPCRAQVFWTPHVTRRARGCRWSAGLRVSPMWRSPDSIRNAETLPSCNRHQDCYFDAEYNVHNASSREDKSANFAPALEYLCKWQLQDAPSPPQFTYVRTSIAPSASAAIDIAEWCLAGRLTRRSLPYTVAGHLRALKVGEAPSTAIFESKADRVVRSGIQANLEVFWLDELTGWTVRTLERLECGQFVCEYAGEVLTDLEAEARCSSPEGRDAYLFNLTSPAQCLNLGAQPSAGSLSKLSHMEPTFVIDAFAFGNVGRFLNHACGPSTASNVTSMFVFVEEKPEAPVNLLLPRVAFFANRRIEPGEELRYDYDMQLGEVSGLDGGGRSLTCRCRSEVCRGRIY